MIMRAPLIAGNWKMHKTLAEARELVSGIRVNVQRADGVEVLVCPPVHLSSGQSNRLPGQRLDSPFPRCKDARQRHAH